MNNTHLAIEKEGAGPGQAGRHEARFKDLAVCVQMVPAFLHPLLSFSVGFGIAPWQRAAGQDQRCYV